MTNEIKYFSMFTGVGGFELGLENSQSLSEVEQDWEGWNRSVNEWGALLRSRQVTTLHDLSESQRNKPRRNEKDSTSTQSELLAPKQFTCVGMSEFNKYSNQVLKYRFPNIKNWEIALKSSQKNYQTLICSVEDFLAKHSQSLESGKDLKILEKNKINKMKPHASTLQILEDVKAHYNEFWKSLKND